MAALQKGTQTTRCLPLKNKLTKKRGHVKALRQTTARTRVTIIHPQCQRPALYAGSNDIDKLLDPAYKP